MRGYYAEGTQVPVFRSKAEIDRMLESAGADQRSVGSDDDGGFALCVFRLGGRHVRLKVPLPKADDRRFTRDHHGHPRPADLARRKYEQGCRERWRALVLLLKAKLESIALGLSTPEREFLADIYLPNGLTVHEALEAGLRDAYSHGTLPPLLGPAPSRDDERTTNNG